MLPRGSIYTGEIRASVITRRIDPPRIKTSRWKRADPSRLHTRRLRRERDSRGILAKPILRDSLEAASVYEFMLRLVSAPSRTPTGDGEEEYEGLFIRRVRIAGHAREEVN